jgi:unspecific monooxygenase
MDAVQPNFFIPPRPPIPERELPLLQFLRAIRTNALTMWTEKAYQEDVLVRRFLGRSHILLNAPDAIHHVLVDNHANYRRSPASIRILRPITGNGLLLSDGEDWRLQRRTTAPALAPRTLPVLARHIVACADDAIGVLGAQTNQPIDLLAAMQNLALDIAGRSMFSLETRQYGAAMRRLLTEYAHNYSKPHLFDMVLPPAIPTLRDFGRRRFQRRWMGLMTEIMQARQAAPATDTPRDLFDLLLAARDPETGKGFST